MAEFWHNFVLTFVPLFIVIEALGTLPVLIALGEDMTLKERHKMINVVKRN